MTALEERDLDQATALSAALNWPYRPEDWKFAHALGEGLALHQDDRLIGTGMRWNYGPDFATIGMIIVDSAFRGQGLGARLVDGLLHDVGQRSVVLNATLDGLPLYRRRDFIGFGQICQHQGIAGPVSLSASSHRIEPANEGDWPALVKRDRLATGMPRDHLLAALADCGDISVLRGEDGSLLGYAVCREFGRGHVVGPVVARDSDRAMALLGYAMRDLAGSFVRVDTSARSGLGGWLEEHGLLKVDTVEAMVRGTLPTTHSNSVVFALCSQSLG
jgi:GNAT superfamily N-acetyltransferase